MGNADAGHLRSRTRGLDRLIIDSKVPTHRADRVCADAFVISLIRATPSSPRSVTMSVAPNSFASFCRNAWTAHGDDPLRSHLLRREARREQADSSIADNDDR